LSFDAPFQEQLEEVRTRTIQSYLNGAIALGTDMGLNRDENQDRVLAAQVYHSNLGGPAFVAAVADGMGGMADGGTCATIALAAFLDEFISPKVGSLALRLTRATASANNSVFQRYRERGGTTLSAIAIDDHGIAVGVNVGDSRIYASTSTGFVQLTTEEPPVAYNHNVQEERRPPGRAVRCLVTRSHDVQNSHREVSLWNRL
jgi:serine/threonine protein phosphatase PrpC